MIPIFNIARGLWNQKPSPWGTFSDIQTGLRDGCERLGINFADVEFASPAWNAGTQLKNYITDNHFSQAYGAIEYTNNSLLLTDNGNTVDNDILTSSIRFGNSGVNTTWLWDITPFQSSGTYPEYLFNPEISTAVLAGVSIFNSSGDLHLGVFSNSRGWRETKTELITFGKRYQVGTQIEWPDSGGDCTAGYGIFNGKILNLSFVATLRIEDVDTEWDNVRIGYGSHVGHYGYSGYIHSVLKINSLLDETTIASLFDNPWQLWRPRVPTYYSFPAATSSSWSTLYSNAKKFIQNNSLLRR